MEHKFAEKASPALVKASKDNPLEAKLGVKEKDLQLATTSLN